MAVVKNFEDLECWKAARVLVNDVYEVLDNCRDFTFCDQMKRAALSVMNNIAEGYARRSPKERINFMNISVGSANEVRSMIYTGQDQGHITDLQAKELFVSVNNATNLTYGFLRYLHKTK